MTAVVVNCDVNNLWGEVTVCLYDHDATEMLHLFYQYCLYVVCKKEYV